MYIFFLKLNKIIIIIFVVIIIIVIIIIIIIIIIIFKQLRRSEVAPALTQLQQMEADSQQSFLR